MSQVPREEINQPEIDKRSTNGVISVLDKT